MHLCRWTITLLLTLAFATGAAFTAVAQSKKQLKQAQKRLAEIKLVDGPGSGLDADTVQGVTPSQLKASITPPSPAEILSAVKSVDGTGSGLDADKLQGLTPAQVAALAPAGGGAGLVVRDVNGTLVGTYTPNSSRVILRSGDNFLNTEVNRKGFTVSPTFSYEGADCSGPPLMPYNADGLFSELSVHGATGYFPSGPNAPHSLGSFLSFDSDAAGCTNNGGAFTSPDRCCTPCDPSTNDCGPRPVSPVSELDLSMFVPPFHLSGG